MRALPRRDRHGGEVLRAVGTFQMPAVITQVEERSAILRICTLAVTKVAINLSAHRCSMTISFGAR